MKSDTFHPTSSVVGAHGSLLKLGPGQLLRGRGRDVSGGDVLAVKRSFILQALQLDSPLLSLLRPSVVSSFSALEELQVATVRSGKRRCKLQFHPRSVAIAGTKSCV